ncbi:MAG: glycosyltransferase family 25 protein [Pseudomonadota bacterium]|nr:glycosyltransferase family 25 protein [Pseudomonadota bacterium]
MKIFVINLPDRTDRREYAESQLKNYNYTIYPAISVESQPEKYFKGIKKLSFLFETGRFLVKSEIACYASHLKVWKKCVALDESIIVLEDDFYKTKHFDKAINYIKGHINHLGFIRLEPPDNQTIQSPPLQIGEFSLHRLRRTPFLSTAYAISPQTARSFVKHSEYFSAPVDHMVRKTWVHQKPLFLLKPAAAEPSKKFGTSIQGREKSFLRHLLVIPRFIYRNFCNQYALFFDRHFEKVEEN